jgi:hypothetical protein
MNARTFGHVACRPLCLVALLAACDQPAPKCNVAHGAFWAKYTLVSGDGDCAMLTGEELDVQSYYAKRSAKDPRPDYDNVSIAIQPMTITAALGNAAGIAEPDADDVPYAIGRFGTTSPSRDGYCVAKELAGARLRLPAVPDHEVDMCTSAPAAPDYDLGYEFSNVRVYYTPAAIGTQFAADLTYTQAGCVAKYKVTAVYPMVSCAVPTPLEDGGALDAAMSDSGPSDASSDDAATDGAVTDDAATLDASIDDAAISDAGDSDAAVTADAGVTPDAGEPCPEPEPPTGPPVPDDSLCENAGINPDFAVVCDPTAMMCVLEKQSPSLK